MLVSTPAKSQQQQPLERCSSPYDMKTLLFKRWQEHPVSMGAVSNVAAMMLYRRADRKSWTLVLQIGYRACIVASGTHWEFLGHPPAEEMEGAL